VQRTSHELLAGSSLTGDQHRRSSRGHSFDGFEHLLDRPTLPDDLLEVVVTLDLFLEIAILLLQLDAEPSDLLVRAHVLDGEGNLFRNFFEQRHVVGRVPIWCEALQQQCSEGSSACHERNAQVGANSAGDHDLVSRQSSLSLDVTSETRLSMVQHPACRGALTADVTMQIVGVPR